MTPADILPLHPDVFTLTSWDGSDPRDVDGPLLAITAAIDRARFEDAIVYVRDNVTGRSLTVHPDGSILALVL